MAPIGRALVASPQDDAGSDSAIEAAAPEDALGALTWKPTPHDLAKLRELVNHKAGREIM